MSLYQRSCHLSGMPWHDHPQYKGCESSGGCYCEHCNRYTCSVHLVITSSPLPYWERTGTYTPTCAKCVALKSHAREGMATWSVEQCEKIYS